MALFNLLAINNFELVREFRPSEIDKCVVKTVRALDEREEMEPWIQSILFDTNHTPHGPSEIVDILTHKMTVSDRVGMSAFILKGRSFDTVRPKHVAHQIMRLERIKDLSFAVLAASGNMLDEVKEQFVAMCSRLGVDYCILDAHDLARLFVAYGFICPRDGSKTHAGRCDCGYSSKNKVSNVLQQEALRALRDCHELNQRSAVVILPTGAGKTRLAAIDIHRTGAKLVLFVAHTHEILESAEEQFLEVFSQQDVQRFDKQPSPLLLKRVNLITIQSLALNLTAFSNHTVDYLVFDEFHHAPAPSYRATRDALRPKFLLGLTATPFRADRQDVLELCDNNIAVCYEMRQGIEFGVLCPYHYFGCFDDVDYSNIQHNGHHYDVTDLERALIIPKRDSAIIEKWKEKADGSPTLAFCCSQRHAIRMAEAFNASGIPSAVYISDTQRELRQRLREDLRKGKIRVLCVVDVLNEGVDMPFVECLLFLRPTDSKRIFIQQLGRGLRRFVGKRRCVVIDFIGNFKNAYRVVENLGLEPSDDEDPFFYSSGGMNYRDVLKLPLGCEVEFDERVISVFGDQTLNPAFATRRNIANILRHQYRKLAMRLGHLPTRKELDRNCILGSNFYIDVFGSWESFLQEMKSA
ncbi:MAG: DEAD/DEAH box helicase family protein [Prosthecobacter sp.]